jgi:hypothetical protein
VLAATSSLKPSVSEMHWITKVREPSRLLLAWQPPDGPGSDRKRRAVAEIVRGLGGGDEASFRYLRGTPDFEDAISKGFTGYPAFRLDRDDFQGVMAALMRRLPPRSRPDFEIYRDALRISRSASISDFGLLAASEAKLPSDGFSVVDPFDDLRAPAQVLLEIAGYRHNNPDLTPADIGSEVEFLPEPENEHDSNAVRITLRGKKLGYVNKLQAPQLKRALRNYSVRAVIERLNGQQDRPRAFIFVDIDDC